MDCKRVRVELGEYAMGGLSGPRRSAIACHLSDCACCREALVEELDLQAVAREALVFDGVAYGYAALEARMRAMEPLARVLVILPKLRHIGAVPRFAVAGLLLLFFAGLPYAARHSRALYSACKAPMQAHARLAELEFPEIYEAVYAKPEFAQDKNDIA